MLGRRFLLIVALLMGLTALAASVAPQQDPRVPPEDRPGAQASPTPGTPAPTPADATLRETISADEEGQRVVIEEGDVLELTVTGSELDTVSLEGLGEIEPVEEDSDALFNLLAEEPGQHPIELLESGRRIGTLVIREES